MKDWVPFAMEHPDEALLVALVIITSAATVAVSVVSAIRALTVRLLRHTDIKRNGWPPAHCDADGDLKPAVVNKEDMHE